MALLKALEMVWKTLRQAQHPSTLIKPTHGYGLVAGQRLLACYIT